MVSPTKGNFGSADLFCKLRGATLASINGAPENEFVSKLCGQGNSCWLGIVEKAFSGDKSTSQTDQKWMWADGSTPDTNNYQMWNAHGDAYGEPNNGQTAPGALAIDERRAVIKDEHWFDEVVEYEAYAVCEMVGQAELTTTTTTSTSTSTTTSVTAICSSSCSDAAATNGWSAVCHSRPTECHACNPCEEMNIVACPDGWLGFEGKCYKVNTGEKESYFKAKSWCNDQSAQLVSVNSAKENDFVWRICGTGTDDPIMKPVNLKRTTCWLGLTEKDGTGNLDTRSGDQEWVWADGTTPPSWQYANWQQYDGKNWQEYYGSERNEPNNGRSPGGQDQPFDERYAVMNQAIGGYAGRWYDKPAAYEAHAVCELDPSAPRGQAFIQRTASSPPSGFASWAVDTLQHLFQPQEMKHSEDHQPPSFAQLSSGLRMRGSYRAQNHLSTVR